MKKIVRISVFSLIGMVALSMGACSEDQPSETQLPEDKITLVSDKGEFSVAQFDTLRVSASLPENLSDYKWTLDGKEVSAGPTFVFTGNKTGTYKLALTACGADGKLVQLEQELMITGRFGKGTFVLNEGNMSDETGTLTFIDESGALLDSAYYRVNGTLLGNVCQDLFIADGKMYVISQKGARNGGEGMLTVMLADNLEKVKVYNDEIASDLSWPSNVAVVGKNVYIRDNNGISMLDSETNHLQLLENTKGALKLRMAVSEGKVFAGGRNEVLVIQGAQVVQRIPVDGAVSGIVPSYDGKLWVSYNAKPGVILKLNPADGTIIDQQEVTEGGLSAGWGVAPAFSAVQDTIYFCNATTVLYRHIFKEKKSERVADFKELLPDAGMYYNSLGVNPISGVVCFATLKGYGQDYKINDIGLFDFKKELPLVADFKSANSFPAGVYYTYNFE